ncbi:hypothetical protein [Helicobacter turcicus]|uniref:DNA helicase n=1 Tax=Helicobacter turcicus TaxID=2867412 RepID=A0ABS7JN73_9HELI|nr:hypothetical protein [Helicobacter turcicus]MBX7490855.1 hypothetical protein [Helicobacter turcicus]MBX7545709.1 hypothetical protein [Helicobacter turcicus]
MFSLMNPQKNKENFSTQDPHIKITTVHSFKGMETKAIIFVNTKYDMQNIFETHIAITQATELIAVFNRIKKLEEYGKSWSKKINFT